MLFKTLLDVIEEDLKKWRAGKKLHKYRIFWCAAALPGGIFLYGVFHQQPVFFLYGHGCRPHLVRGIVWQNGRSR